MTAGSWIYIGSQGIVQGTFETFAAAGENISAARSNGKFVLTGGLGGMGGAQPLAATMNGAIFLGVEVDPARIEKRLKSGYCDKIAWSLDEALKLIEQARKDRKSLSVGLVGNCANVLPEIVKRGIVPDVLTDQTSAHDCVERLYPAWDVARRRARAAARKIRTNTSSARCTRWLCMSKRCSPCNETVRSRSITETTFERRHKKPE